MQNLLAKINSTYLLNLLSFLFLITFLIYSNTLLNGLFFDDEQFIYENQAVQSFQFSNFFTQSLTTGAGQLSNYYRPFLFLTFSLEYQLFGGAGFIYHLSSVLIHIGGGLILFLLLTKLFANRSIALLTSLLWLVHPIQTEAVSYASGRGDPLSFLFVVLTIYLSLFKTTKYTLLALGTLLLALLSKELALITPGLIFISHVILERNITKKTFIKAFKASLPFFLIAGFYFILRLTVLNFANTLNFYNGENAYTESLFVRLNTFFHLMPEYIKLLVYPKDLFMERDLVIDIQTQPTFQSLISFFLLLILTTLSLLKMKQVPWLLYSLGWFVISFIPTMGIIPINGIFYEHFLYYPSVGFFFLFSFLFFKLLTILPRSWQTVSLFLLTFIILLLGWRTIARNAEWRDPITFYTQTLSYAPSARIFNNLAMAYAEQDQQEKAIENYRKAIELSDMYPETHYNLGNSYAATADLTKAEAEYKKSLELNPYFYLSYIALFNLYDQTENQSGKGAIIQQVTELARQNQSFIPLLEQLQTQNN